jgi:hypothetical protein
MTAISTMPIHMKYVNRHATETMRTMLLPPKHRRESGTTAISTMHIHLKHVNPDAPKTTRTMLLPPKHRRGNDTTAVSTVPIHLDRPKVRTGDDTKQPSTSPIHAKFAKSDDATIVRTILIHRKPMNSAYAKLTLEKQIPFLLKALNPLNRHNSIANSMKPPLPGHPKRGCPTRSPLPSRKRIRCRTTSVRHSEGPLRKQRTRPRIVGAASKRIPGGRRASLRRPGVAPAGNRQSGASVVRRTRPRT